MSWTHLSNVEHDLLMNGVEEMCKLCGDPLELRFIGINEWIFYCSICMNSVITPPIEIKKGGRS